MEKSRNIRLYFSDKISVGGLLELADKQAHYLLNVMRCKKGESIKCFNVSDGEFLCRLEGCDKKKAQLFVEKCVCRPQKPMSDIWIIFAPLKKDKTDFVIEKATELGASKIIPVNTQYTNAERIRLERLNLIATEAAEQCGRLDIPQIMPLTDIASLLSSFEKERTLFFMDERRKGADAAKTFGEFKGQKAAILIGPEGGFSNEESLFINSLSFVKNINLGPRILRAETAVAAALSVWQSVAGDWSNKGAKQ